MSVCLCCTLKNDGLKTYSSVSVSWFEIKHNNLISLQLYGFNTTSLSPLSLKGKARPLREAHFSLKEVKFDSTALLSLQDFPHILHMEVKVLTVDQDIIKVGYANLISVQGIPPCISEKQLEHLLAQKGS